VDGRPIVHAHQPGPDNRRNASLNAEWIQLDNRCAASSALTSTRIKDASGHTYTFSGYALGAGRYVKVHTGRGTNTSTDRCRGQSGYTWNDDRDTASYYSRAGALIDRCSHNNARVSSVNC
jgi:hypothetical protein